MSRANPAIPGAGPGEYPLGWVTYSGKNLYEFGLRENEWIQHMAILVEAAGQDKPGIPDPHDLKNKGKPFLVFDWKRNYRDLLVLPEFQDVEVYTIGGTSRRCGSIP